MNLPLEVAHAAIAALNAHDWAAVAALVDLDDLNTWYSGVLHVPDEPTRDVTARDMKRYQPDKPDAVAEFQAAELNRQRAEAHGKLHGQFAGLDSRAELSAMDPAEALARYIQAQDPSWRFEEQIKKMDSRVAPYAQPTPSISRRAIGFVLETPDIAHVVYSVSWPGEAEAPGEGDMKVATLHHTLAGWRLRLRGELFEHGNFGIFMCSAEDDGDEGTIDSQRRTDSG